MNRFARRPRAPGSSPRSAFRRPTGNEGELLVEILRVLDDAHDRRAPQAIELDRVTDRCVEQRRRTVRQRHLAQRGRIAPVEDGERRSAEPAGGILAADSSTSVDPGTDTSRWVMTSTSPNHEVGVAHEPVQLLVVIDADVEQVSSQPECAVAPRRAAWRDVVGRGGAEQRARDGDGQQGDDEDVLPPLAPQQPQRPVHDGTAGRTGDCDRRSSCCEQ